MFDFLIIGWFGAHVTGKGRTKRFCSESGHCGCFSLRVELLGDIWKGEEEKLKKHHSIHKSCPQVASLNVKLRHLFTDCQSKCWQPIRHTHVCLEPRELKKIKSDFREVKRMTELKYKCLKNSLLLEEKTSESWELKCLRSITEPPWDCRPLSGAA